ncbi:hypothetical protein C7S13_5592 [Burkholderia cepacia]|nr:hypothetical protein [Burkholderia cepacia]
MAHAAPASIIPAQAAATRAIPFFKFMNADLQPAMTDPRA